VSVRSWKKTILNILVHLLCLFLFPSCASLYFQRVSPPEKTLSVKDLGKLPFQELWSGFVFNGEKVGFTYLKIVPLQKENRFRITSEAHMHIRFLGMNKQINMKSIDIVKPDLTLVSFHYEQNLDDKSLVLDGEIRDGLFRAVHRTGGQTKTLEKRAQGPLYPASIINLYPVRHGLQIGAKYRYTVFDPQVQAFADVFQSVESYEESPELLLEPSFKVNTRMHDHQVTSWINLRGETIFEIAMGGVLITHKETKDQAERYLSEASLNKKDLILDFSLIPTEKPIPCPRDATYMEVSLTGVSEQLPLLHGPGQEVEARKKEGKRVALYRLRPGNNPRRSESKDPLKKALLQRCSASSFHIESDHTDIIDRAKEVVEGTRSPLEQVQRLVTWVSDEVKDEAVDSDSALEVLRSRRGECQAHTMLYTALARALGIPTRLIGGLVYMEGMGFLYHSWAESYVDGWISVDPTFNQVGVDATHIKLVHGDSWFSVLKLGKVIGKVKARVLDFKASCR